MDRQAAVAALLIQTVRDRLVEQGVEPPATSPSADRVRDALFCNSRSMRLSDEGFKTLSQYFEVTPIEIPAGREVRSSYLLYLDRQSSMPWYLGHKGRTRFLYLFDGKMAVDLLLRGEDFDKLLKSRRLYGHDRRTPQ